MRQRQWIQAMILAGLMLTTAAVARPAGNKGQVYLPVAAAGGSATGQCAVSGQRYESLFVAGPPISPPAEQNPDINLGLRGYKPTTADLKLVTLGPVQDRNAPQFPALFADRRTPLFSQAYQRHGWDWDCGCPTDAGSPWATTVLGMAVQPGEVIHAPDSGYDIGGGYEYLVLYAAENRLTLHIGREDDLAGYVVHLENVCVEPGLLALYQRRNSEGRDQLPALRAHQPLGRAIDDEIRVAVRDNGHFLDPRSRNDWWQGW